MGIMKFCRCIKGGRDGLSVDGQEGGIEGRRKREKVVHKEKKEKEMVEEKEEGSERGREKSGRYDNMKEIS